MTGAEQDPSLFNAPISPLELNKMTPQEVVEYETMLTRANKYVEVQHTTAAELDSVLVAREEELAEVRTRYSSTIEQLQRSLKEPQGRIDSLCKDIASRMINHFLRGKMSDEAAIYTMGYLSQDAEGRHTVDPLKAEADRQIFLSLNEGTPVLGYGRIEKANSARGNSARTIFFNSEGVSGILASRPKLNLEGDPHHSQLDPYLTYEFDDGRTAQEKWGMRLAVGEEDVAEIVKAWVAEMSPVTDRNVYEISDELIYLDPLRLELPELEALKESMTTYLRRNIA